MNWLRSLGLQAKINLVVIAAAGMLAAALLILLRVSTNTLISEVGYQRAEQEISVISKNLLNNQDELITAGSLIANTSAFVNAVAANDRAYVRSFGLTAVPSLSLAEFIIFDRDGDNLATILAEGAEFGPEQEAGLINQALIGVQRLTIVIDESAGKTNLKLVLIRTLRDSQGEIVGGILLARQLSDEWLTTLNFERNGIDLTLVHDGQVVARSATHDGTDAIADTTTLPIQPELVSAAAVGTVAINPGILTASTGVPYTEAYLPVQAVDDRTPQAVLVVRVANGAITDYERDLGRRLGITLAGLVIALITVLIALIRMTLISPIKKLQAAATAAASGDYAMRLQGTGNDELGRLAQSFDGMAAAILERETDLNELNKTLEQRVQQLAEARDQALAAQRIANENARLKSEFLATMSHELRTPMNAIEGFTSIMLSGMGGVEFNEKTGRYVQRVNANSKRLLGLINDFLDLSRIESGRLELANLPFSPRDAAMRWKEEIGVLAQKKNLNFEVSIDPDIPETVYGDEEALSKVAVNLLSNAIKFTETGSIALKLESDDDAWRIEVSDTGIGIPMHAREFIFEEFRQVDQTTKRKYGGTGLGLAIAQRFVRSMGGTITVKSEIGQGSTFTVTLPATREAENLAEVIA